MANSLALAQLLGEAATDAAFEARLVKDPRATLAARGVEFPPHVAINVVRNDASTFHAALPVESPEGLEAARRANPMAAKVFERAWRDPAFKARLMSHPREAFIEATGLMPPASLRLIAHEDTPAVLHLVIPHFPFPGELDDAELEHVAGGKGGGSSQDTSSVSDESGYNQSLFALSGVGISYQKK